MMIRCPECSSDMSSEARQCPKCGAPNRSRPRPVRTALLLCGGLVVAFLGYGFFKASTPDGKARSEERRAIELCRDSLKDLHDAGAAKLAEDTCRGLEANFRLKWHAEP